MPSYNFQASIYHWGKSGTQGGNLDAESEEEAMEELCLQDCSSWLAEPTFLDNAEIPTQGGTAHSGLGPFLSIINQEMLL